MSRRGGGGGAEVLRREPRRCARQARDDVRRDQAGGDWRTPGDRGDREVGEDEARGLTGWGGVAGLGRTRAAGSRRWPSGRKRAQPPTGLDDMAGIVAPKTTRAEVNGLNPSMVKLQLHQRFSHKF